MHASLIVLALVFIIIAGRQLLSIKCPIWLIVSIGAIACLVSQQVSIRQAWQALNWEVLSYLFGVFVLSSALEHSGLLEQWCDRWFSQQQAFSRSLAIIVFGFGLSSALLLNDTIAIIATPIICQLTRHNRQLTPWLLMLLAYSITIGSVMSPIGNPQNILIANHLHNSHVFARFLQHLALPTLMSLGLLYLIFYWRFRKQSAHTNTVVALTLAHKNLAVWAKLSLLIFCIMVVLKLWIAIPFSAIALASAIPILLFGAPRRIVWRHIDWGTLLFFASLFIVMQSVWQDGVIQSLLQHHSITIQQPSHILIISAVVSQLISNVPLVALYLPLLGHGNTIQTMALAAGSTLAGNLFVFGAASNIIISDNAEKRGFTSLPFWRFALYGIPMTIIQLSLYWLCLSW